VYINKKRKRGATLSTQGVYKGLGGRGKEGKKLRNVVISYLFCTSHKIYQVTSLSFSKDMLDIYNKKIKKELHS
jgi:hypothetical protein